MTIAPHPDDGPGLTSVVFTWHESHPERPAQDVLVRLIGVTDHAQDDGELDPFLLDRGSDGEWGGTIELPSDLRTTYQLCVVRDEPIRGRRLDDDRWTEVMGMGIPDPSNPSQLGPCTFGNPGMASVLELPEALPQPWAARRADVPRGALHRRIIGGGDDASVVHLYAPAGYDHQSEPLPLVVLFDARWWIEVDVCATFDNLVADGATAPFAAALVESIHGLHRVQSLTRPAIVQPFLLDELLLVVSAELNVTEDPRQTVIAGQSLGALAALSAALEAPGRFGLALSQSGAFWWPGEGEGELGGPALEKLYAVRERAPLRLFVEAGSNERRLLLRNRDLRDTLVERGYEVTYREYRGGHDYACWRGGLADGLVALLGD